MKLRTPLLPAAIALTLALGTFSAAATAAQVAMTSAVWPEKSVDVTLVPTERNSKEARAEATVKASGSQVRIGASWKNLQPALLFGGEVTTYVLWAVTRDGLTENLGELPVRDDSGSATFQTGHKAFGLLVTAESYPGVSAPSELVVFTSGAPDSKDAPATPFSFSGLAPAPKANNPTIANMSWTSRDPVSLVQAMKILEIARQLKAADVNPKAMEDASVALAQATNSARGGSSSAAEDYSRRATALASEAIRDANRAAAAARTAAEKAASEQKTAAEKAAMASKAAAEKAVIASKAAAEKAALEQKVATTKQEGEATAASLKAQIDQIAAEKSALAGEKAALEKQRTDLEAERDALTKRLGGALDRVSSFQKTGRGMMMSLGDISFDIGKSTLKPPTQVALGKLAGVLMMLPEQNIRIEGFTDATGSEETNRKLSAARAKAVRDFLEEQGVSAGRMTYGGYGPANPVASNDTAQGRAKNRRVEITLGEGKIEATPGGVEATSPTKK
ncbi:MAG: OmpA family protein [Thermoanaerobaculia bacterium]